MTRSAFLGAPLFMLGYGIARLIDGLDGSYGPGTAWTIGHLMFLVALLLFVIVLFGLHGAISTRGPAGAGSSPALARGAAGGRGETLTSVTAVAAVVTGVAGLLAFIRSAAVDLVVGLRSAGRPAMDRLYPHYDTFPGLPKALISAVDAVGPALLIAGLLTLTIQLAVLRPRRLRWWSPVLLVAGFAAISASLDLLPLGGLLLLVALAPMRRRTPAGGADESAGTAPHADGQATS